MRKLIILITGVLFILAMVSINGQAQDKKTTKKDAKTTVAKDQKTDDKSAKKDTKESKKSKKDSKKDDKTVKSTDKSGMVYITDKGGSYHKAGCKYLKGGGKAISLDEAKKKYKPCKVCKP